MKSRLLEGYSETVSTVILGAGVAGLSAALQLSDRAKRIVILEREATAFGHSSSKNAAIFRPLEVQASLVALAARARTLLLDLEPRLLQQNGLCLVARQENRLDPLLHTALEERVPFQVLQRDALWLRAPWLRGGSAACGLFLPHGGTIDLKELARRLCEEVTKRGATLRTSAEVTNIEVSAGRVSGVKLRTGESIHADEVVIAAGAWAPELGHSIQRNLPIVSHRRHLAELEPTFKVDGNHPVCWDIETEVYFRPHGDKVLACPGDDTLHDASVPDVDPDEIARLSRLLVTQAPCLADARVDRSWACLRTRCSDGSMAIGADPSVQGLYWLAGLGGHGMTVGLAAGEMLATLMRGQPHALASHFAVNRLTSV